MQPTSSNITIHAQVVERNFVLVPLVRGPGYDSLACKIGGCGGVSAILGSTLLCGLSIGLFSNQNIGEAAAVGMVVAAIALDLFPLIGSSVLCYKDGCQQGLDGQGSTFSRRRCCNGCGIGLGTTAFAISIAIAVLLGKCANQLQEGNTRCQF